MSCKPVIIIILLDFPWWWQHSSINSHIFPNNPSTSRHYSSRGHDLKFQKSKSHADRYDIFHDTTSTRSSSSASSTPWPFYVSLQRRRPVNHPGGSIHVVDITRRLRLRWPFPFLGEERCLINWMWTQVVFYFIALLANEPP